jgi:hypothetical protein
MMKNFLSLAIVLSVFTIKAQTFTKIFFELGIASTTTSIDLTFDYDGVFVKDLFESQCALANPYEYPDFNKKISYSTGTSYNKTDNLITMLSTAGLMDLNENSICIHTNPTSNKLYIINSVEANQIKIIDS